MDLHFIPRSKLIDRLNDGWRLVPGHEYSPGEYAILMFKPEVPEAMSAVETRRVSSRFEPTPNRWPNNTSRGAANRVDRNVCQRVRA